LKGDDEFVINVAWKVIVIISTTVYVNQELYLIGSLTIIGQILTGSALG